MTTIISYIVNGLAEGCVYALMASGLAIIWGTLGLMNFAQGEFYMIGAFGAYVGQVVLGWNIVLSVLLGVVVAVVVGALFDGVVMSWLTRRRDWEFPAIVATLGLSIVLQNVALHTYGSQYRTVPYYIEGTFDVGGVRIVKQWLLVIAVTVVAFLLLRLLLRETRLGIGIRTTSQDRDLASLQGIRSRPVFLAAICIGVGLAGLGGALLAPVLSVSPYMGSSVITKAFVVVILGGLGSIEGAALAGIALGVLESVSVAIMPAQWSDVAAFVLLIVVMWVRPEGLMGAKVARA